MGRLIILGLIFISSLANANVSISKVRAVYLKLVKVNRIQSPPQLRIISMGEVNAWYDSEDNSITVASEMLSYLRNNDEIAKVLGHELGHYAKRHKTSTPNREYTADKLGAHYMKNAGYSICKGAEELKRYHHAASPTHPSSDSRYKRLGC